VSYIFYWPVSKNFRDTEKLLVWAKKHCPSYITNDVERNSPDLNHWRYRFYFGDEKDYLLCMLTWG
jgi:hypothetical protein